MPTRARGPTQRGFLMSQYPPQPPQPPYPPYGQPPYGVPYAAPASSVRPGVVTALSVLGMAVGGFFTLCAPCGIIPMVLRAGPPNPALDILRSDKVAYGWAIGSMTAMWVLAVALDRKSTRLNSSHLVISYA